MTGGRPQVRFGLPTVAASTDEGGGDDFLKIPGAIRRVKVPTFSFLRMAWMVVCAFLVALFLDEIWQVVADPEQYAPLWGGEGPAGEFGYYSSRNIYLAYHGFLATWFFFGATACFSCRLSIAPLVFCHFLLSLVVLVTTVMALIA